MDEVNQTEKCSTCKQIKSLTEFHKNKRRATGYSNNCSECQNKFIRNDYKHKPDVYKNTKKKLSRKRLDLVIKIKSERGCTKCGEKHPACLDFHHRNKNEKVFNIARSISGLFKMDRIMNEIAKCDVVCSNCHRKEHWDEITKSWNF